MTKTCYLTFLMLLPALLWYGCESDIEKVKKIASQKEAKTEKAREVEIIYSEAGYKRVKIVAPTLLRHMTKEPYTEMPNGVKVFFYNEELQITSKLTANYGIRYQGEDKMMVQDDVVVINTKGEKLNAEELVWDEKKEKIISDKFVKITTKDEIIYGEGLVSNQDFTSYKIRNIEGTIKLDEEATTGNDQEKGKGSTTETE